MFNTWICINFIKCLLLKTTILVYLFTSFMFICFSSISQKQFIFRFNDIIISYPIWWIFVNIVSFECMFGFCNASATVNWYGSCILITFNTCCSSVVMLCTIKKMRLRSYKVFAHCFLFSYEHNILILLLIIITFFFSWVIILSQLAIFVIL